MPNAFYYEAQLSPDSPAAAGLPEGACWFVNYDPEPALHNFMFLKWISRKTGLPARVFVSRDCAAIVTGNLELDAVREPHVMAWRDSFQELSEAEFIHRARQCLAGHRPFVGSTYLK